MITGFQESIGTKQAAQSAEVRERIYGLAILIPGTALLRADLLLFLYPLDKERVSKK